MLLGGSTCAMAEDFNWEKSVQKMQNMLPKTELGTTQKITMMTTKDIDNDGISECLVMTDAAQVAVFSCGNGKGTYAPGLIKLIAVDDESNVTMSKGAVRTYEGASPGYENEHVYKLSGSNVVASYHRKSDAVRKGKTVYQDTKCTKYNKVTRKWDAITEPDYEKQTKEVGEREYTFSLTWDKVKAQSVSKLYDDMVIWQADNSNVSEEMMSYFRDRLTNEARQHVAQNADSSDADWQTAISLLNAPYVDIKATDLMNLTKVRSLQIKGSAMYGYDYFKCRFFREVFSLSFDKTAGSQRKNGLIERVTNDKLVFDGFWYYGVDGKVYDDDHRSFGIVQKTADGRVFMLFPADRYNSYEIYLFAK